MAETIKRQTLINEAYLKSNSPLPKNFDISEVEPFIPIAERMWLVPVIGIPLYEELLQQVNDNDVTPENSTLLLEIYPYLSYSIVYEALPFIMFDMNEKGVTKGKSENSEPISASDREYINTHIRSQVEVLKKQLKDFLDANKEYYPLYKSPGYSCGNDTCGDDLWLLQYHGADRETLQKLINIRRIIKDAPNPHCQIYSTGRKGNDIY